MSMTKNRGKLLTTNEVGSRCSVSGRTVARWLRTGELTGVKLHGRVWRIEEAELERFIAAQTPSPE